MRCVVQRVSAAKVVVAGEVVGEMATGLLCLVAAHREDDAARAEDLARKLVHLRIFPDAEGRMNRSLLESGGAAGVVSQFTLYGDTRKGRRPFFGEAAPPEVAEPLVERVADALRAQGVDVITGRFGAHMDVSLTNDGPVTLILDV